MILAGCQGPGPTLEQEACSEEVADPPALPEGVGRMAESRSAETLAFS
jgi:hypothetical protein